MLNFQINQKLLMLYIKKLNIRKKKLQVKISEYSRKNFDNKINEFN